MKSGRVLLQAVLGVIALSTCACNSEKKRKANVEVRTIAPCAVRWRQDNGGECPTVKQLRAERYYNGPSPTDPWGSEYAIRCAPARLSALSAGPDRRLGTDDDIVAAAETPKPTRSPAGEVLERWLEAETPEERAEILYRRDITEGEFLVKTPSVSAHPLRLVADGCQQRPADDGCRMIVERTPGEPQVFWLRATSDGYRVDWRSSYVVNPMTMAAFRAAMPTTPSIWRLDARLDSYFNFEWVNAQATHYSFRLAEVGEQVNYVHAYAKKGEPDAEAMFEALSNGGTKNVTVSLAFPRTRRNNGIVKLVKFYGTDFRQTEREDADRVKAMSGVE
ncbi:MAG: hypothetical protein KF850_34425 [Labilithrix sp.]|nr:hypothetical protein [Labilithrix sp.]MBX3217177.1 hypothetical protein [Labilithrix sp.]